MKRFTFSSIYTTINIQFLICIIKIQLPCKNIKNNFYFDYFSLALFFLASLIITTDIIIVTLNNRKTNAIASLIITTDIKIVTMNIRKTNAVVGIDIAYKGSGK